FANPQPDTNTLYPFGVNNDTVPVALSGNNFRTQFGRAIAADPLRPGTVYAAEAEEIDDPFGNVLDEGDVIFARSTDYGVTWPTTRPTPPGPTRARATRTSSSAATPSTRPPPRPTTGSSPTTRPPRRPT